MKPSPQCLLAEVDSNAMEVDLDWHTVTPYHSLVVIFKVVSAFPDLASEPDIIVWQDVVALLLPSG